MSGWQTYENKSDRRNAEARRKQICLLRASAFLRSESNSLSFDHLQHRVSDELVAGVVQMHAVAGEDALFLVFLVVLFLVFEKRLAEVAELRLGVGGDLSADLGILV